MSAFMFVPTAGQGGSEQTVPDVCKVGADELRCFSGARFRPPVLYQAAGEVEEDLGA